MLLEAFQNGRLGWLASAPALWHRGKRPQVAGPAVPSFFRRDSQLLPDMVDEALEARRGRQDVPLCRWGVGGGCC
jgi:hypothetical protein